MAERCYRVHMQVGSVGELSEPSSSKKCVKGKNETYNTDVTAQCPEACTHTAGSDCRLRRNNPPKTQGSYGEPL